ncbi:MAG: glycosyltransferase [Phycisphaerales bacterium]
MSKRVLLLLSQLPLDPSSGAARTMMSIAGALAKRGFDVRSLSSSAMEAANPPKALPMLRELGIDVDVDRRPAAGQGCAAWRFLHKGVKCEVMDTGRLSVREFDFPHGQQFSRMLSQALEEFKPEVVFTFGGTPTEQGRRELARQSGAAVVFVLQNLAYQHPLAFDQVDAVISPSAFLRGKYVQSIGLESTVIPPMIDPEEAVAATHDPRVFTFVNPTPNEGVYFFVRLAEQLALKRPDIGLRVIEARGSGDHARLAASHGALEIKAKGTLRIDSVRYRPSRIYETARAILMPVAWQEPWGRVGVEAQLNGVPVLTCDRGGVREALGDGAIYLPLPEGFSPETVLPVDAEAVAPWIEVIERLADDEAYRNEANARSAEAGKRYDALAVGDRYAEFFAGVTRQERPLVSMASE